MKLNNRIKKLKSLYETQGDESDTDIEVNSTSGFSNIDMSVDSLQSSLKTLSVNDDQRSLDQNELKSTLTQNAFAQLVLTASKNKDKVKNFKETDEK